MKPGESLFLDIRGLRYHVRAWGPETAPTVFLLHGWMDVSASFQFLVDALAQDWRCLAPDWVGGGLSDWSPNGSYWFLDRVADLSALVDALQPEGPLALVGHSMGFNIASVYAGSRPARVAKLVNLECHGFRNTPADAMPARLEEWLEAAAAPARSRAYASFDELQRSFMKNHPRVSADSAAFLARHMGREDGPGRVLPTHDPRQRSPNNKMAYAGQLRLEEAIACWRRITAPVLWVRGGMSDTAQALGNSTEQQAAYRAAFRIAQEVCVPEAGHMIHLEAAPTVAAHVEAFLLHDPD